jgi:hypothetical protein
MVGRGRFEKFIGYEIKEQNILHWLLKSGSFIKDIVKCMSKTGNGAKLTVSRALNELT